MMMAAGEHFVGEIDFENLDPEKMTLAPSPPGGR
jgi:hypothetical protein